MSDSTFTLEASLRTDHGTAAARRMRNTQRIPAVIYGAGKDPVSLDFDHDSMLRNLDTEAFYGNILTINVTGSDTEQAIIKDVQRHPSRNRLLHCDFLRVSSTTELTTHISLHFIGSDDAPGIKAGGVLAHNMTEIEISCLPADLPEYLTVDVSAMEMDQSIHLSELSLPEGVRIPMLAQDADHDIAVASIHASRASVEDDEAAEGTEESGAEEA